jgi:hypothetical protein
MATKFTIAQELSFFLGHSIRQMEDLKQRGCITDRLYRHYCWFWLWSAHRHDFRHEVLYNRLGSEFYWRRIDRVKALAAKIEALRSELDPKDIPFRLGSLNP